MPDRLDVLKTYKLYINGAFPRSESGRSIAVGGTPERPYAHICRASRKDLRDAVEAARAAQPKWSSATAYNRGQILYRMAEMMEGKRSELAAALRATSGSSSNGKSAARSTRKSTALTPDAEVSLTIDRLIHYAGWSDKFAQVLGCHNPVSGPFYNFTIPEATGVVCVITPDDFPLLALASLMAPALVSGNCVVAIASRTNPVPAAVLGEVLATSDVPAGVVNLLTGDRSELIPHIGPHRDIDAVHAANLSAEEATALRAGIAENLKRSVIRNVESWADSRECQSPWWIESFVEMKTIWHPASS